MWFTHRVAPCQPWAPATGGKAEETDTAMNWELISNFMIALLTSTVLSLAVVFTLAILYLTLLTGPYIQKTVGELPLDLISRVFGMILIAIAVQFMVEGLQTVFPGWAADK
jgi:hypothetical protein